MTMGLFFAIFCGMVALLFLAVFLFNLWARKQPNHPRNRAISYGDDGLPLHLMPNMPIHPVDSGYSVTTDSFAGGGGDFGGGGADAGWSDSGGGGGDSGGGGGSD